MKQLLLLSILVIISHKLFAGENHNKLLSQLDKTIEDSHLYLQAKKDRIRIIYLALQNAEGTDDPSTKYELYHKLFNEYEAFIYDSAFKYAEKMRNIAFLNNDRERLIQAKIHLGHILMASGMFKESIDTLNSIPVSEIPDSLKEPYFSTMGKTYYSLAVYDNGYFSEQYIGLGNSYMDSALVYSDSNSLEYLLNLGIRKMNTPSPEDAISPFETLMEKAPPSDHKYAIAASGLAYIYLMKGNKEKNMELLIKAAIADIKASTKETVALRNLSEQLSESGNISASYKYIKLALSDATFYNSKKRKIEIGSIMPLIEEAMLSRTEKAKSQFIKYTIILSILSLVIIVFALIIFRQLRNLKVADALIKQVNNSLQLMNNKLKESNRIKEEYIGYFFNLNSENIDKIGKLVKNLKRNINLGRLQETKNMINDIDLKAEREEFYRSFDRIFFKLFPNFVEKFNTFFNEEDRIRLKENEYLTTELRIFALIRMGIVDNERIAKILEYSVNTIYAYKTKIKNKAIIPNEKFEEMVMEIETIN